MDTRPNKDNKEHYVVRFMMPKRNRRYRDRYKVGPSSTVPFIENESWKDRHARRKADALSHADEVQSWCNNHHWRFRINNAGHHWQFFTHESKMIEWWPSSGKLAVGRKYDHTIHTHDVMQLLELLEAAL